MILLDADEDDGPAGHAGRLLIELDMRQSPHLGLA
jgi:hypothetical protein